MTDKRPSSTKLRRVCFDAHKIVGDHGTYMICHICKGPIWPAKGDKWEADHVIRRVLSADDSPENLRPAHTKCHRVVKTPDDIREHAKGKRVSDKHNGIRTKMQWNRRYRKKINGEIVER